jgi:hypothetical protein
MTFWLITWHLQFNGLNVLEHSDLKETPRNLKTPEEMISQIKAL